MMTTTDGMRAVYWIIPDRLGGRPGPNQVPWSLPALKESGVTLVLSLTERMVNRSAEFANVGLPHVCVPLPKSAPPRPGDAYNIYILLPHVYEIVYDHLVSGQATKVVVHCSSGKDRTGLFMTYFMMRYFGETQAASLEYVRDKRPDLLSAEGWKRMALEVLSQLEQDLPKR